MFFPTEKVGGRLNKRREATNEAAYLDATSLMLSSMKYKKGVLFFGFSEIIIGTVTIVSILSSFLSHLSNKPLNVLIFVITSGFISISLGAGILLRYAYARKLLVFFAGWIILSKVFIFAKIITLNGALETTVPTDFKNIISIIYHLLVILYFHHPTIKQELNR